MSVPLYTSTTHPGFYPDGSLMTGPPPMGPSATPDGIPVGTYPDGSPMTGPPPLSINDNGTVYSISDFKKFFTLPNEFLKYTSNYFQQQNDQDVVTIKKEDNMVKGSKKEVSYCFQKVGNVYETYEYQVEFNFTFPPNITLENSDMTFDYYSKNYKYDTVTKNDKGLYVSTREKLNLGAIGWMCRDILHCNELLTYSDKLKYDYRSLPGGYGQKLLDEFAVALERIKTMNVLYFCDLNPLNWYTNQLKKMKLNEDTTKTPPGSGGGGGAGAGSPGSSGIPLDVNYKYDPATNTYIPLTPEESRAALDKGATGAIPTGSFYKPKVSEPYNFDNQGFELDDEGRRTNELKYLELTDPKNAYGRFQLESLPQPLANQVQGLNAQTFNPAQQNSLLQLSKFAGLFQNELNKKSSGVSNLF